MFNLGPNVDRYAAGQFEDPEEKKKKSLLAGLLGGGYDDPQTQGLLGLSAALLQASGPSPVPVSFGQALGKGLGGYTQGRNQAQQYQNTLQQQRGDSELKNQLIQAQIGKLGQERTTDFQRDLLAAGIDPSSPEGKSILKNRFDKNILNPLQLVDLQGKIRDLQQPSLSKGQEAVDKKFADEYVDFKASGGFADVQKGIGQVGDVLLQMELGDNLTGPAIGRMGDTMRSLFTPDAQAAKESVEEVVQRNLRLILGAQFTEKEGERLISRAYNPALDEKENTKRLRRLLNQIVTAAQAKQEAADYFEANGTLKGFKGKVYTKADFLNMRFDGPEVGGVKSTTSGGIQFLGFE